MTGSRSGETPTTSRSDAESTTSHSLREPRRILVLAVLTAIPWSVQLFDGAPPTLRFVWGMVSAAPVSVSTIASYLQFSGAPIVFDWVLAGGFFLLALAATLLGTLLDRRDGRIAAGLLALAGLANLSVAWTFSAQPGRVALPVGTIVLWYVAWRWWRGGDGLLARE